MRQLSSLLLLAFIAGSVNAFYAPSDGVVELTPSNFDREVLQDDAVWIVEFYAPWCGHCQSLVPEYKKLAKALKGVVKVGSVNADSDNTLSGQFGVRGFPTIKIFGSNKRSPTDFNGQRTAKAIAEAALAEVKKKVQAALGGGSSGGGGGSSSSSDDDVIELTEDNFDKLVLNSDDIWLVEFFAPWCGHCKNLAPEWAKAAKELKGKVKLGALDATAHQSKAAEYNVRGYPTIKFFAAGAKSASDAQEYQGGRTASDIVSWASDKHTENVPAPELVQITSEAILDDACEGKPLCIISVLPHILDCDAKCRNKFLVTLRTLGDKYKQKLWGWAWAEGGQQPALEESLEVGGFGYPALAVVNFKKMKFSVLKGSFSKDGISEFLRDISYGRGHTAPVRGAKKPTIVSVDPWDGKDGQLPTEEDIDLSDIDLDDDVKDEL
ncbi:protein disulfide-isomerase A6 homolog [Drosophila guanche]|uniref:Protein disulfide-isomerase A6 homolog n=1 Tax=Drosophila guanche TaxID=7266 RepID=A0A3B0JGK4_DROGU|nr:protein disulfide-isomerase A6 homolog [Drosophila guanche]SPP79392.1 blast:Probable protein disulfide-isomerase A6 [Drosophila guanche]